jgi:hypothetical protein
VEPNGKASNAVLVTGLDPERKWGRLISGKNKVFGTFPVDHLESTVYHSMRRLKDFSLACHEQTSEFFDAILHEKFCNQNRTQVLFLPSTNAFPNSARITAAPPPSVSFDLPPAIVDPSRNKPRHCVPNVPADK